jgi:hypothetical protein
MSKLAQYISKKNSLRQLQEELEALENDESLKKELEFKDELKELQEKYGKSAKDTLVILQQIDPSLVPGSGQGGSKGSRPLQVYKNPHTGEVVKTKGANHKTLKEWRNKWGKEEVSNWRQQ